MRNLMIKPEILKRYNNAQERDRVFKRWVRKNGFPTETNGCIFCAELVCFEDCGGIEDVRVSKMDEVFKGIF